MIYKGTRIFKVRDWDIKEDSVLYIKDIDCETDTIVTRFLLSQVTYWEPYHGEINDGGAFFDVPNKQVLRVCFKDVSTVFLLESLEEFDKLMEEFYKNK